MLFRRTEFTTIFIAATNYIILQTTYSMAINGQRKGVTAFGELMLRLHMTEGKRFRQQGTYQPYYAGSEANVCVLLSRLGIPSRFVTALPENDLALAGVDQLRSQLVDCSSILYTGEKLGIFFTEQGNGIRPTRVLYDRAGSSFANLQPGMIDWSKALDDAACFHWSGISAAVSQGAADCCAEALGKAIEKKLLISADFNYRSTLWKYGKQPEEIMPSLLRSAEVAVADLDAAKIYLGIETGEGEDYTERFNTCVAQLSAQMPALKTLAMSFRNTKGAVPVYSGAIWQNGKYSYSRGFALPVITDQVGTGDAFTAGLLSCLLNGEDAQHTIDFATACGALKQSIAGDWAIISKQEVDAFLQSGTSGRIIR
jgi:2-dehydro-3-deoxygluconokinase